MAIATFIGRSSEPLGGVLDVLYECPAGRQAVLSGVTVQNRSGSGATYSLWVQRSGLTVSPSNAHSVRLDTAISNDEEQVTGRGFVLEAGQSVIARSSVDGLVFHTHAQEEVI